MLLVRYSNTGSLVSAIQILLNFVSDVQPKLVVDGIFGTKTRAAVVRFQQSARLSADGIVGPLTGFALIAALGGGRTCVR